ncbi:transmembrane and coiled-coil domain-containing protein 4-like [Limulus polyphemus]|uniref:Transmembrane and coiled-coil domain-containing protein 4-like n=1 Tax=Limulus polyphemus TaxID=6850 RepID=A0ABM1T712_LIMPO|nr:transmembrane and coiled-coil domain-containing protein 4-like [Limulus polyphemus]
MALGFSVSDKIKGDWLGQDLVKCSIDKGPPVHPVLKPLKNVISDAGLYSCCALCALSLHELFADETDYSYCERCIVYLRQHLELPKQVDSAMKAILQGDSGGDFETYVALLREEPALKENCLKVVEELILVAVKEGVYDARMRVLILHVAWLLKVALPLVELYEDSLVEMLSKDGPQQSDEEKQDAAKRKRNKKFKKYFMIGLASVGGGAVIGLTGGLAAPLVAAGAGAVIGTAGAAALGSAAGVAIIGSLFGVAGAGLTGYKMKKRVGDIEEFAFDVLTEGNELHITLAISGWLSEKSPEAFQRPWHTLLHSREQYCLRYESSYLHDLGKAMDYLFSFAVTMAAQEALKYTILSGQYRLGTFYIRVF